MYLQLVSTTCSPNRGFKDLLRVAASCNQIVELVSEDDGCVRKSPANCKVSMRCPDKEYQGVGSPTFIAYNSCLDNITNFAPREEVCHW